MEAIPSAIDVRDNQPATNEPASPEVQDTNGLLRCMISELQTLNKSLALQRERSPAARLERAGNIYNSEAISSVS